MRKEKMHTIQKILLQVDRTYTLLEIINIITARFGFKRETAEAYAKDMITCGLLKRAGTGKFKPVKDK